MELRMQYATARDGVRIAFGTAGKGAPWIIRCPSLPFSHAAMEWRQGSEFFDQLAANWSVAQFDPRGTGLSDRDVIDFSMEARLLDLEAVVDKLGLETFALHGISWGGPLAVAYAVANPERVSHLILDDVRARTEDFFNVPQARILSQLTTTDWDAFLEYLAFMIYGASRDEAGPVVEYFKACVTQEGSGRIVEAARQDDVTDLLSRVPMPTLVTVHAGVSKDYVESARDIAARIPNAQLVTLEGLVTQDCDKLVRAIGDLLGTEMAIRTREPVLQAPSGVRTILFTDIVDHTSMMRRLGDKAGREVLREHEDLTRRVLQEHGGDEVKTMGDGFMASFASVTGAVECAIALQRAFKELHHGHGAEPGKEAIHVRIGLNAGEPIEEGGDFFGAAVIMASRIAALADSGEILASDVIRGLCSGKGFLFADRGENVLRGFEDAVRVWEVRWRE
jgi:class 3 adenylate cyclase